MLRREPALLVSQHVAGTPERKYILETIGSRVALLDYDRDGWLDIYLVNGSDFEAESGNTDAPKAALFHNNHDGTFTDVTEAACVKNQRQGSGAVVADYDNDGWPDIFLSNYGKNRLYHNNHNGTFTDVARERAGGLRRLGHGCHLGLLGPGWICGKRTSSPYRGTPNLRQ